jgi:hypothetical protein
VRLTSLTRSSPSPTVSSCIQGLAALKVFKVGASRDAIFELALDYTRAYPRFTAVKLDGAVEARTLDRLGHSSCLTNGQSPS